VQHVRPQAVGPEISQGGPSRELVGAQERGVDHARRLADHGADQLMESQAARSLGEQGQHDVPAVVVDEPLTSAEHRFVSVEHRQVLLGRRELVHGNRHDVVADVATSVLVKVIADPGPMRHQLLDRHVVGDQGQVLAQQ
jgi:hypothetical protein